MRGERRTCGSSVDAMNKAVCDGVFDYFPPTTALAHPALMPLEVSRKNTLAITGN